MTTKILLIEDNPADADFLQEILEEATASGFTWELVWVEFLNAAILELMSSSFNIILLDLSLPDSHGLETLIRLKDTVVYTPLVVMTGLADESIALEAVRLGAQDYLVKGQITSEILVRTLRYALERSQTLQLLQEREQRFRAIFNSSFQLTQLLNPQGNILEINQTTLYFSGLKSEEIRGKFLWELPIFQKPFALEELQENIKNCAAGKFIHREVELLGKMGQTMVADFSMKPVKGDLGEVILLIAEFHDISERKQAEKEIIRAFERERELSELRAKFVTTVSHEFRTPLTTIQLSTGLLKNYSHKWSQEKMNSHFERIELAIKRMTDLLEDILVIGKIESEVVEFEPTFINLGEFCERIIAEITPMDNSQHPINFSPPNPSINIFADPKLLRQIIYNVLSNALKYSPKGSPVILTIDQQNQQVLITITDQGIGILAEEYNRIFEAFQRGSNVGNISGTGLGLAIVKRSIEIHQGSIKIESIPKEKTSVIVTLPLSHPPLQLISASS